MIEPQKKVFLERLRDDTTATKRKKRLQGETKVPTFFPIGHASFGQALTKKTHGGEGPNLIQVNIESQSSYLLEPITMPHECYKRAPVHSIPIWTLCRAVVAVLWLAESAYKLEVKGSIPSANFT